MVSYSLARIYKRPAFQGDGLVFIKLSIITSQVHIQHFVFSRNIPTQLLPLLLSTYNEDCYLWYHCSSNPLAGLCRTSYPFGHSSWSLQGLRWIRHRLHCSMYCRWPSGPNMRSLCGPYYWYLLGRKWIDP